MYQPKHFCAPDATAVDELVRAFPLASLVLSADLKQSPSVDPVAMACESSLASGATLFGHVARANPIASLGEQTSDVIAIFTGVRAYISPNSYASKQEHHRVVPTYNYCTVVAYGKLRLIDDAQQKLRIVRSLTDQLESHRPNPWSVDDAPQEYLERMLNAIVGLAIDVNDVQAKFKISQNRELKDRESVRMALASDSTPSDAHLMAKLMEKYQPTN